MMTHPVTRLGFDATHLPPRLARCLEEAITCHSHQCYTAAAIMVRKTLEELCHHQEARGDHLVARLRALKSRVVLPEALFEGLDRLRLLGNDAAHLEAKAFHQVGPEEVEVAIDFTKEVLKASYQYDGLLARLKALEKAD